jgi:hypothetical protein
MHCHNVTSDIGNVAGLVAQARPLHCFSLLLPQLSRCSAAIPTNDNSFVERWVPH